VAVEDPHAQQTHPQVQRLIDAAQVGATVRAAPAAPGVARHYASDRRGGDRIRPRRGACAGVKSALVLSILRRLMTRRRIESVSWLEAELRRL
jgi:hypothetical protein